MQLPQLLIVLLVAFASCNCCQYTLPNDGSSVLYDQNAKGEDVVQGVLSRIEEANIFDSDHYFMRRLAYVETEDGNKSRKLGIWAYDLHYQTTINNAINDHLVASNAGKRVCEEFGINVTEVDSRDVKKPLFSGVMARFYLFALNVTRNKSIPVTVPEQATFWNEEYNRRRKMHFKTPSYYLNHVLEKECKGCHDASLCNWTSVCNETGKGEKVVNDVLSFIEYTEIFDFDHQFMRRLAYVETRDGENLRRDSSGQYGIWAYNLGDYQTTVVNALRFAASLNFSERVFKRFGINVTELDSRDVKKPLVSGVMARFYLFALNVTENKRIPVTVPEQATFWHEEYNSRQQRNEIHFVNRVQELEGKACKGFHTSLICNRNNVCDNTGKGEDIVQVVLSIIENSTIFDYDHYFMRRLAYVETKDGEDLRTSSGKYGIWAYDLEGYNDTVNNATRYNSVTAFVSQRICVEFGINVTSVNSTDVMKPIVSGVMACFYLLALNVTENKSIPVTVPEQATFWNEEYNSRQQPDESLFKNRVQELVRKAVTGEVCQNTSPGGGSGVYDPNENGEEVVHTVLSIIEEANIFDCDHYFMRRLAYVETRDGELQTSNGKYGIWAYNLTDFAVTVNNAIKYHVVGASVRQRICEEFGIDVTIVRSKEVEKPLVSAVMARFYLLALNVTRRKSIPITIPEQAIFWIEEYNSNQQHNASHFEDGANELEGKGCPVNADIVFVLDLSGSISKTEYKKIQDFQYNFVNNLKIGRNHTQVGTIIFKGVAKTKFDLQNYHNKSELLSAIKDIEHNGKGGTNIPDALCSLKGAFCPLKGGRPPSSAIYRIAILLSDGRANGENSDCCWESIQEAADDVKHSLSPILIYTIGVGDNTNETELQAIATSKSSYTHIDLFDEYFLQTIQDEQSEDFCWKASVHRECDEELNYTLGSNETFRYNLVIGFGITLNICIMEGEIEIYGTTLITNPSKVFNEWHLQLVKSEDDNDTVCDSLSIGAGTQSDTTSKIRRRRDSEDKTLYISVTGRASSNVFVVNSSTLVKPDDTTDDHGATDDTTDDHGATRHDHGATDSAESESLREREVVEVAASSSAVTLLLVLMCCIIIAIICTVVRYRKRKKKKGQESRNEDEYHLLTETNEDIEL